VVPIIPRMIVNNSGTLNFSLIMQNANMAAKIGPVVKLMVLERARGMNAMAAY
jgi:hypothetical protein